MKIGSNGSAASTAGLSSRLKSINLRPVGGQSEGTGSSTESTSGQSGDTSEDSRGSLISGDSDSNSSPTSPETSVDGFPFYNPRGEAAPTAEPETSESSTESSSPSSTSDLSPTEKRKLQDLKRIDSKVRAHEQAHMAAAGSHAQGGISFEYAQGPDGQRYAVGGEVQLDASKASTPEETVQKLRRVKAAALAPADPSPQDLKIASSASRKLAEAQGERTQGGESSDAENDSRTNESSEPSGSSVEREAGNAPSADGGIEGPADIGVDVEEDVGRFIADQTSSNPSSSTRGNGAQNGANSTSPATYGPEPSVGGASTSPEGSPQQGQSVNVLI